MCCCGSYFVVVETFFFVIIEKINFLPARSVQQRWADQTEVHTFFFIQSKLIIAQNSCQQEGVAYLEILAVLSTNIVLHLCLSLVNTDTFIYKERKREMNCSQTKTRCNGNREGYTCVQHTDQYHALKEHRYQSTEDLMPIASCSALS